MYNKKVDPQGLSLEQNLVALPDFESIEETYTTLPEGYAPGFIAEVRSEGIRAVLLENGPDTLLANEIVEGRQATIRDFDIAEAVSKGSFTIPVTTSASATSLFKNRFKNGYIYIAGGTGVKENGAYRKLLLAGNEVGDGTGPQIDFYLAAPLPVAIDATTDIFVVSSVFMNVQQGDLSGQKSLGIPLIDIEPRKFFWSIYDGQTLGITGQDISDDPTDILLTKDTVGRLQVISSPHQEIVGKTVFTFGVSTDDLILVNLYIEGIRQLTPN